MTAPNADSVRLTKRQRDALAVLRSDPRSGFDCARLARNLETSPEGAARTAASLCRLGLADRFVGGIGPQRVHYQAAQIGAP